MGWQNYTASSSLLYESDGPGDVPRSIDGKFCLPWMGARGDIHGCGASRTGQCGFVATGDQDLHRYLSEAAVARRRSMGYRISVAANVPSNDGLRTQGRGDDGDQRG